LIDICIKCFECLCYVFVVVQCVALCVFNGILSAFDLGFENVLGDSVVIVWVFLIDVVPFICGLLCSVFSNRFF